MYKLILYLLLSAFILEMFALQTDEEIAMNTLFYGKHALNRAVHAAVLQSDLSKLSRGIHAIDSVKAEAAALQYLQRNLRLDTDNQPLPDTFLKEQVHILEFTVINEDHVFPYTYENAKYDYTATLYRPGVVMIIELSYPRTYGILSPITWQIKGTAEIVI